MGVGHLLRSPLSLDHLKKYAAAETAFERAIKINPDYISVWQNLGKTLYYQGKYEPAIAAFDRVIKLNPDLLNAWAYRGDAYYYLDKQAISNYDRAIAIDKNDVYLWVYLRQCF